MTIGEQVMTSTDPTFQPLAFEDSLQEAKEQTAAEKLENKTATSAESKDSKDPKDPKDPMDPPQGPVGLFSHGTLS